MDLFPVGTNIAACNHPFAVHALAVAGRVFEVPFAGAYDRAVVRAQDPFHRHCLDHSNVRVVVSAPTALLFAMMEDLNLEKKK